MDGSYNTTPIKKSRQTKLFHLRQLVQSLIIILNQVPLHLSVHNAMKKKKMVYYHGNVQLVQDNTKIMNKLLFVAMFFAKTVLKTCGHNHFSVLLVIDFIAAIVSLISVRVVVNLFVTFVIGATKCSMSMIAITSVMCTRL